MSRRPCPPLRYTRGLRGRQTDVTESHFAELDAHNSEAPGSRGFPHGIVAFANLFAPDVERILEAHAAFPNFRGVRQILNQPAGPDEPEYLEEERWCDNYGLLRRFNASFDMQIHYHQMPAAARLASRYPDTPIILNHAGMPGAVTGEAFDDWRRAMHRFARCENVWVKISGLGMSISDIFGGAARTIFEETVEAFGSTRVMLGSNFPVDGLHSSFGELWALLIGLTNRYSPDESRRMLHDNAAEVYRLED